MHNEELLVQETLGSVQLPANLTENIMRQVADLKLTPPQVGKPLLPWAAFGTAVLLVALMLGTHNQYLARFQQPYSLKHNLNPQSKSLTHLSRSICFPNRPSETKSDVRLPSRKTPESAYRLLRPLSQLRQRRSCPRHFRLRTGHKWAARQAESCLTSLRHLKEHSTLIQQ